jgi:hypothetical protein
MKFSCLTSIVALVIAGCGSGTEGTVPTVGGGLAECENHAPGTTDDSPEVTATIKTLVPSNVQVRCTGKQSFPLNGRQVFLVFVPYGNLNDCPAGCFTSEACAIYDQSQVQLYSAMWFNAQERPLSIPPDCPGLAQAPSADTNQACPEHPPGFLHPVTQTTDFKNFQNSQMPPNNGSFRWCFS